MKAILIGKDFKEINKKLDDLLLKFKDEMCFVTNVDIIRSINMIRLKKEIKIIVDYNRLK